MEGNPDLIDLLRALNEEDAEYLIVGGYAFAFHGKIRATKDVDIFVGTDRRNADRVWNALSKFGAPLEQLCVDDLTRAETYFIMGRAPCQIDIITTIDGIDFANAWGNRVPAMYGGIPTQYIGRDDLIANKSAAARPQDIVDVTYLKEQKQ